VKLVSNASCRTPFLLSFYYAIVTRRTAKLQKDFADEDLDDEKVELLEDIGIYNEDIGK
jgi:hypothetical protein